MNQEGKHFVALAAPLPAPSLAILKVFSLLFG